MRLPPLASLPCVALALLAGCGPRMACYGLIPDRLPRPEMEEIVGVILEGDTAVVWLDGTGVVVMRDSIFSRVDRAPYAAPLSRVREFLVLRKRDKSLTSLAAPCSRSERKPGPRI
jgi:hypothetical protein